MELVLRDPTYRPESAGTHVARTAERFIHDRRDVPFLRLMAVTTLTVIPTGLAALRARAVPLVARGGAPRARRLLHGPLRAHAPQHEPPASSSSARGAWMNQYIPWVLGPFFGESPETYFAHHVGHAPPREQPRGRPQLHDALPARQRRRTSCATSCASSSRVLLELMSYLGRRGRAASSWSAAPSASCSSTSAMAGLFFVNWRATLFVFVLPFVITRFAMMAGNWAQHAFIDAAAPENYYRNSITCINSLLQPAAASTTATTSGTTSSDAPLAEMPEDFLRNIDKYEDERRHRLRGGRLLRRVARADAQALRLAREQDRAARAQQRSREELVECSAAARAPSPSAPVTQPAIQARSVRRRPPLVGLTRVDSSRGSRAAADPRGRESPTLARRRK